MMSDDGELIDTGTTSIHVSKGDVAVFDKYGMRSKPVGQVYHQAVREMDRYRETMQRLRTLLDRFDRGEVTVGKLLTELHDLEEES